LGGSKLEVHNVKNALVVGDIGKKSVLSKMNPLIAEVLQPLSVAGIIRDDATRWATVIVCASCAVMVREAAAAHQDTTSSLRSSVISMDLEVRRLALCSSLQK
jgi:hypothetical protein